MKILIDLQPCQGESSFRGIGRYSMSLAKAIARNRKDHEIYLLLSGAFIDSIEFIKKEFKELLPEKNIITFFIPTPVAQMNPENIWHSNVGELIREYAILNIKPDIVHISSLFEGFGDDIVTSIGQFSNDIPTSVTLYDLIPLIHKETLLCHQNYKEYYLKKIEYLKKANLLLAISESSKKEAVQYLNINEDKIVNISAAVNEKFRKISISNDLKDKIFNKYNIEKPFMMYAPGGFDPRKNIDNLIDAFSKLPKGIKENYQLVIISKIPDGNKKDLENKIAKTGLTKNDVIITGYVPDDELIAMYNLCELFIFPSLHEGFGLPVLEAMACGAPVIGSNTTSIPEVIGREDALFDPYSVESIANKIKEVLTNDNFKNELREYAIKRAKEFSWDKSAKRAIEAFEDICDTKNIKKESWSDVLANIDKNYKYLIDKIVDFYRNCADIKESDFLNIASSIAKNINEIKKLNRYHNLPQNILWRLEGPFDSSYSLALVNRELAKALKSMGHNVLLYSTEGPGDFLPDKNFLEKHPDITEMYQKSLEINQEKSDVTSRLIYPPRVNDMRCKLNFLHCYAWEESGFPNEWVEDFNEYLQGIACISKHVKKVLIDNGVNIPLSICGCGVDHWLRIAPDNKYRVNTTKNFRFLHVSSCFPRKGVDVLLKAYMSEFKAEDDVSLIIKTFKNPHNKIYEWLANAKSKTVNPPEVIIIEDDLTDSQLKALYEQCHCLVNPSRAEGFGLPMAEAMLSDLPVITTGWGGVLDFCTAETAWLIDFYFDYADTHFNLFNSVWAEPNVEHLSKLMREVYSLSDDKRKEKTRIGKEILLKKFKWSDTAKKLEAFVRSVAVKDSDDFKKIKLGWVSTWNSKCGIAEYSKFLIENIPPDSFDLRIFANQLSKNEILDENKEKDVTRVWGNDAELYNLYNEILNTKVEVLVIQYNFGFFNVFALQNLIEKVILHKIKVFITFHSVKDVNKPDFKASLKWINKTLKKVDRIFVHNVTDLNILKSFDLIDNVTLFPHGVLKVKNNDYVNMRSQQIKNKLGLENKTVISSYGFLLPNKGIKELIEAFFNLKQKDRNLHLLLVNALYPNLTSSEYLELCMGIIKKYNLEKSVTIISEFLSDEESLSYLKCADLIVMPYQKTNESASGAIRFALASEKPVLCTPLDIFNDVKNVVHFTDGTTPEAIAEGIINLLNNKEIIFKKIEIQRKWINENAWPRISQRFFNIIKAIYNDMELNALPGKKM